MNLEELYRKIEHLENLEEIKKLQRKYQYWLYKQDYEKIVDRCFARKTPGLLMEASDSGIYKDREGIRRFFLENMAQLRKTPGAFTMHLAVAPIIEIAGDGRTAKSIWFSPGCAGEPMWVWGVYMVDYVKEDGEWKLWHVNFNPLFRTPYDKGWREVPIAASASKGLEDGPPTRWNPYDKTKAGQELFHHLPDAPDPYERMEV